jgi:hypothetical protein
MPIRTVVTRGFGNGTFSGAIRLTSTRGFIVPSQTIVICADVVFTESIDLTTTITEEISEDVEVTETIEGNVTITEEIDQDVSINDGEILLNVKFGNPCEE